MQELKELGYIGIYSPEERRKRIQRFLEKRKHRVWTKKVKYDVRKVRGVFVGGHNLLNCYSLVNVMTHVRFLDFDIELC